LKRDDYCDFVIYNQNFGIQLVDSIMQRHRLAFLAPKKVEKIGRKSKRFDRGIVSVRIT
jgi:hypothetical protein